MKTIPYYIEAVYLDITLSSTSRLLEAKKSITFLITYRQKNHGGYMEENTH